MIEITDKLEKIVDKKNIYINEPMSKHTSFKIGGIADYFIKVHSIDELKDILEFSKKENIPFYIIGNGTNLLVRDGGIRGIVIKLEFNDYSIEKKDDFVCITVGSGMTLARLAYIAFENELSGIEQISGIPGTIGGAIRMNAGAYGREMKDIVVNSKCMNENGDIIQLDLLSHEFSYRKSAFSKNNLIILETTIKLEYGLKDKIKEKMDECKNSRIKNQPLEFPNAGSTFKRNENIPTAKLIDDCGLKGFSVGGAEVSTKHSGFIINKGNATSKDVLELVNYIKTKVKEKYNQDIELEIIVLGEE